MRPRCHQGVTGQPVGQPVGEQVRHADARRGCLSAGRPRLVRAAQKRGALERAEALAEGMG